MAQIKDLRDFLAELRRRGRLHEFTEPISKETELMPLYRVQTRGLPEEERSALLFKDVRGSGFFKPPGKKAEFQSSAFWRAIAGSVKTYSREAMNAKETFGTSLREVFPR